MQSVKTNSIDEYLEAQPEVARTVLEKIRQLVKEEVPGAEEVISYQMPAFKFHGILIWFAGFKNHYGIYPYSKTIEAFKEKLKAYEISKGTIRLPYDKPVPVKLIRDIVKFNLRENLEKTRLKEMTKTRQKKTK
jgi:uncharacterized protein YdhG (YjbR/CyaY superfamily)